MAPIPTVLDDLVAAPLDRDVVLASGPDTTAFLQGQLSQDVAALEEGVSAWTFLLQPAGKVDAWLRVTRLAEDRVLLDVEGGFGPAVVARLERFKLRTEVGLEPLAWTALALRGPGAESVPAATAHAGGEQVVAARAGWPGIEGVDLLGPDGEVEAPTTARLVDAAELEAIRISLGVPRMGAELTEATIPAEVGQWVVDESVSFTKGCFTGQELVARIDSRGGNVPRRVLGVVIRPEAADDGRRDGDGRGAPTVPVGAAVLVDGDDVGRVTSVAPGVALASVTRKVDPPVAATLSWDGGQVEAEVRAVP